MKFFWIFLMITAAIVTTPAAAQDISPATIFGKDDRKPVTNTAAAPYNAVCRLEIIYQDGTTGYGTGFIYGENLLATAAHCLYDTRLSRGGRVTSIMVYPAVNGEEQPFEPRLIDGENSRLHYPKEWASNQNWRFDYGVIETDTPWDSTIQPLKLAYTAPSVLEKGTYTIVGYDHLSSVQYRSSGRLEAVREDDLLYEIDILHGQSGAPVLDKSGNVVGIANYGAQENGQRYNSAARITRSVYRFLTAYTKKPAAASQ